MHWLLFSSFCTSYKFLAQHFVFTKSGGSSFSYVNQEKEIESGCNIQEFSYIVQAVSLNVPKCYILGIFIGTTSSSNTMVAPTDGNPDNKHTKDSIDEK